MDAIPFGASLLTCSVWGSRCSLVGDPYRRACTVDSFKEMRERVFSEDGRKVKLLSAVCLAGGSRAPDSCCRSFSPMFLSVICICYPS
jgi:hypothetical protein